MSILDNISSAAYDLERGRLGELTPVACNFTIVRDIPAVGSNILSAYRVFSYGTVVMRVCKRFNNELLVLIKPDAFHHSTTTSRHVRRFLSALLGRVDFDALYRACKAENAPRLIDVSQFTC